MPESPRGAGPERHPGPRGGVAPGPDRRHEEVRGAGQDDVEAEDRSHQRPAVVLKVPWHSALRGTERSVPLGTGKPVSLGRDPFESRREADFLSPY